MTRAPQMDPHHGGFQSAEARAQATKAPDAPSDEVVSGEVATMDGEAPPEMVREDDSRIVHVRSREYIAPFRFGSKMYTIPANKPTAVPLYVKRHLEEKGLL